MWYVIEECSKALVWHRARHGARSALRTLNQAETECARALAHLVCAWQKSRADGMDRARLADAMRAAAALIPPGTNLPRELARFFYYRPGALGQLPKGVLEARLPPRKPNARAVASALSRNDDRGRHRAGDR